MKKFISEADIHHQMRLMTLAAVCGVVLLIMFALAAMHAVQVVFDSSYRAQIEACADEFSLAVRKQSSGDLSTLSTLTQFIRTKQDLTSRYVRARQNHSGFELIGFWDTDGRSSQVSISGVTTFSHFNNMPVEIQQAVIAAWNGRAAVSAPFYSEQLGKACIAYAAPVQDADGSPVAAISAVKDIGTFDSLLSQLSVSLPNVSLFLVDAQGTVMANSSNIFDITHLDSIKALRGLNDAQRGLIDAALSSGSPLTELFAFEHTQYRLSLTPLKYEGWFTAYIDRRDIQSSPIYSSLHTLVLILLTVLVLAAAGGGAAFLAVRRSYLQQLAIAFYDPLTEGSNLRKFELELDRLSKRGLDGTSLAALNVRDFHFISEHLGQQVANQLLKIVSAKLQALPHILLSCRAQDDQFYVLLNLKDSGQVKQELHALFAETAEIFAHSCSLFPVVFYAGVVNCSSHEDSRSLLHKADFVQRLIPKVYTHSVRFYDEDSYQSELSIKQLELNMRPALEQGEFKLFLQPKYDLKLGRITAAEALVRWVKPDGTIIFPNDFIPVFEKNGFCAELDLYIFEQVCRCIRSWLDAGLKPLRISVNQSKQLIFRPNYIEQVQALLTKYRIPPHFIIIEILENIMAQDLTELSTYISRLRAIGLSISMDDFGAGYSSLNMLSSLDIDELKFDKEFLLESDPDKKAKNRLILQYLLRLAAQFKARTVVEGVENPEDVEFLKAQGCDLAQGYCFSRPVDLKTFDRLFMTGKA